jgi:hypothetical protein
MLNYERKSFKTTQAFGGSEKVILLNPIEIINNNFKEFTILDFFDTEDTPTKVKHQ